MSIKKVSKRKPIFCFFSFLLLSAVASCSLSTEDSIKVDYASGMEVKVAVDGKDVSNQNRDFVKRITFNAQELGMLKDYFLNTELEKLFRIKADNSKSVVGLEVIQQNQKILSLLAIQKGDLLIAAGEKKLSKAENIKNLLRQLEDRGYSSMSFTRNYQGYKNLYYADTAEQE
ncbi:MAG: hypothetical protein KBC84_04220 [Proteobacteria bacterium]|nr:hypothetical protein [Pseudomonadota bacterium]